MGLSYVYSLESLQEQSSKGEEVSKGVISEAEGIWGTKLAGLLPRGLQPKAEVVQRCLEAGVLARLSKAGSIDMLGVGKFLARGAISPLYKRHPPSPFRPQSWALT